MIEVNQCQPVGVQPNPSIERTPSRMLRMPTVAAHVQR
jgi:hypothetical protein